MARSRRKTPICGITCKESDRPGKAKASRALRAAMRTSLSRALLKENLDEMDVVAPLPREVSNVYSFPKDGKQYLKDKNASWFEPCMRK